MKKLRLAVFGHYDSRGGTMAVVIPEFTEAAVNAAKRHYNKEGFGIEEPGDVIESVAYGMPARECDKAVHSILYPDTTPGEEDFMYVAELHHQDGVKIVGDDLISEMSDVMIDEDFLETEETKNKLESLTNPVQLELIVFGSDWDEDLKARTKRDEEAYQARMNKHGEPRDEFEKRWGRFPLRGKSREEPPEVDWIRQAFTAHEAIREGRREERKAQMCKVLKFPATTNWDDDAFGFVVMEMITEGT